MSAQVVIDPLRFARSGESLSGALSAVDLPRLADRLAGAIGDVRFSLVGQSDVTSRPSLRLRVEAEVPLTCQRCLEPFEYALRADVTLLLARNEAELARWEEQDPLCDGLVAEANMDIKALVEDELLLGLPVAPRHAEGDCRPSGMPKNIDFS